MTAEVLVMNKLGVALAADSAVTVTTDGTDAGRAKIWQSADKLFALSKHEPVAVMVYGGASFLGTPWETIAKLYRRELGRRALPHVADYATDFRRFLEGLPGVIRIPEVNLWLRHMVQPVLADIAAAVTQAVQERPPSLGLSPRSQKRVAAMLIKGELERIREADGGVGTSEAGVHAIMRQQKDAVARQVSAAFDGIPLFAYSRRDLEKLLACYLSGSAVPAQAPGVVVAGYGEEDAFPSFESFRVVAVADGQLRWQPTTSGSIDEGTTAVVQAFAQQETVSLFMNGIDQRMRVTLMTQVQEFFRRLPGQVARARPGLPRKAAETVGKLLSGIGGALAEDMQKAIREESERRHWGPIMHTMAHQPKGELPVMAETLVTLTSFRKRVSLEEETVGGPVDVMLITKGDGLVWIKRKHYFDAALNHQFFANYFGAKEDARDGRASIRPAGGAP
jgi:hypothetical protein